MITDLSTTAASNSPAGSDSPVDGDNFIRALSAFVASLQTGSGNGVTAITSPGFIPNSATIPTNGLYLKAANNPALSSNTTLRWDVGSAGNHTFAAPSSGVALTVIPITSNGGVLVTAGAAANSALFGGTAAANNSAFLQLAGNGNALGSTDMLVGQDSLGQANVLNRANVLMNIGTNNTTRISIAAAGNVTIAAPSSGVAVTINGFATATTLSVQDSAIPKIALFVGASERAFWSYTEGTATLRLDSDSNLVLAVNNTAALSISSASNVTIAAPSAGVGLTQTGFAGSDTAIFNGGTSGSFRVNTTGVPYGTSLHNNAGAVTGTTNQYITSGTWTPTATNVANMAAGPTISVCQWMRVGNVVSFSIRIQVGVTTAAATATQMRLSLPIASAFATDNQASGTLVQGATGATPPNAGSILANAANADLVLSWSASAAVGTGAQLLAATGVYVIV